MGYKFSLWGILWGTETPEKQESLILQGFNGRAEKFVDFATVTSSCFIIDR